MVSVWIRSSSSRPAGPRSRRPSALTMPLVATTQSPSGLPRASTTLPTRSAAESPHWRAARSSALTRITARSASASAPATSPRTEVPSWRWTITWRESRTTWKFVTASPAPASITNPEPKLVRARPGGQSRPRPPRAASTRRTAGAAAATTAWIARLWASSTAWADSRSVMVRYSLNLYGRFPRLRRAHRPGSPAAGVPSAHGELTIDPLIISGQWPWGFLANL